MDVSRDIGEKRQRLLDRVSSYGSCAVAYSGGVDSSVVAKAAVVALGDNSIAITGMSPSLAEGELERAAETANHIGIRHRIIQTQEFANPDYVANPNNRCFFCKDELYSQIERILADLQVAVVANGANKDDLGDYRPGLRAAANHRVVSPLADCELTKKDIRALAEVWNLPVWDKPASPCLSSRVAYGIEVTPERLGMIDRAEQHIRHLGFPIVRVRYLGNDTGSIEVPKDKVIQLKKMAEKTVFPAVLALGFRSVTIDPEGYRSGSLNEFVDISSLRDPS